MQQTITNAEPDDAKTQPRKFSTLFRRPETGALSALVLLYAFFLFAIPDGRFGSFNATAAWLNIAAELGIIGVSVGLLMIAGELDLSIGSVVGCSAIMMSIGTSIFGVNPWLMMALTLAVAGSIGLFNAAVVSRTGIPSFIATLATNFAVAGASLGLARLTSNTVSSSMVSTPLMDALFAHRWGQANVAILWWVLITVLGMWVLNRTRFGNWIFATGGNLAAARGAGVPTTLVKYVLFVSSSCAASLVGIIQTVEFHSGNATNGQGYVFQAPVVAVIGGVLLTGGYGSVLGFAIGAALYGIISVGIFYSGWNTDWVQLFIGALLLLAVLANSYFRKLALSVR